MARTWLSIEVELVAGRGEYYWPRPGRIFVARRAFTFRQLAEAINVGFGRWELAHLHRFVLEDGTDIVPLEWDDPPTGAVGDSTRLSILEPGQQFAYEFDLGDGWEHVCTVAPERVDPVGVYGTEPPEPAVYFGWGDLPDQHGRRFREDDGSTARPPQPDPPTADLPPVLPHWGGGTGGRRPPTSSLRGWPRDRSGTTSRGGRCVERSHGSTAGRS